MKISTCFSLFFLTRTNRVEADLVDQLFNSRESGWHGFLPSVNYGDDLGQEPITVNLIQEPLTVNLKSLAALAGALLLMARREAESLTSFR